MANSIFADARLIDPAKVRDLAPLVLDSAKRIRVMPASFYAATTMEERAMFGMRNAQYGFPTLELVDWLKKAIAGRNAIEIGAGSGVLANALEITATDNRMQEWPRIRSIYSAMGQPVITYGPNVQNLDALEAVRTLKPQVVIASWVTHKYDPARHEAGGNEDGVNEEEMVRGCEAYIAIGNAQVHRHKSIWALPHQRFEPPWLYSRSHNGSKDFIAVWGEVDRALMSEAPAA